MTRSFGVTAVAFALLSFAGCSSASPGSEPAASSASPIQGGTVDTTDTFAVGVIQSLGQDVAFCSGALLAPNLVATARHCVADLASTEIDCTTSKFGATVSPSSLRVTTASTVTSNSQFVGVSQVIVPTGPGQDAVCGNDIALLILAREVPLAQYVVPVIDPPMTDATYSRSVTAIGYGIDTPTDTTGTSAGVRRRKEDIPLACIPNDPSFNDCFADPTAKQFMTAGEFMSGDGSTCEGDSGSSAYDQASFDAGRWVSFGVLSRGGVSADGDTCTQPIYTRFDAWGPLIVSAAMAASSSASQAYPLPSWAAGSSSDAAVTMAPTSAGPVSAKLADGTSCQADNACSSNNCVSLDGANFLCASACDDAGASCSPTSTCTGGYCFPVSLAAASSTAVHAGSGSQDSGCAMAAPRGRASGWTGVLSGLGIAALGAWRRRRTRGVG